MRNPKSISCKKFKELIAGLKDLYDARIKKRETDFTGMKSNIQTVPQGPSKTEIWGGGSTLTMSGVQS